MAPKPLVLKVDFTPLNRARQVWNVVGCQDCGCRFYERQDIVDYASDEMLTRGRASLYLQFGAGLAQLCRPVARLPHRPGSHVLDIGCGFGFGLDFAVRARGWMGRGIDPAQIARLGAERLGLCIENRMLGSVEKDLAGAFDVVMAAETIEHVASPPAFLKLLVGTLAPGGVLVLTTPDAEALRPETPAGQLVGLLSPELHVVFQSEASLRRLLHAAGLTHVEIERDGGALVAIASAVPLQIDTDLGRFRSGYRAYLESRAADFPPSDDLFWGFLGRAFCEAVNDGDFVCADRLQPMLRHACQQRFAIDLDRPGLFDETAACSLERMSALIPLNLGALMYADAMRRLGQDAPRPTQAHRLSLAAEALRRLNRAVGELAMADPLSEELAWAAEAEALLCAAAGDCATLPDLSSRLLALTPGPGGDIARRDGVLVRALVFLVNAARYDEARVLAAGCALFDASPATLGHDATFCRAVLDLQPEGDPQAAREGFGWVRRALQSDLPMPPPLFWAALRGEIRAWDLTGEPAEGGRVLHEVTEATIASGGTVPVDLVACCPQD